MRADDQPFPTVALDPVPQLAGWPVRPVLAVADGAGGWLDATCGLVGAELSAGPPDDHYDLPAAHLVVNLDNRDGRWSSFNLDGTPTRFGPGTPVRLWAQDPGGARWWLFAGTIGRNDQAGDDSVSWDCWDAFSDLAQPVGKITAGADGDLPGERVQKILAAAGRADLATTRLAPGQNTLAAVADDHPPLDQLERAVSSDGGIVWCDADGSIRSLDRHFRNGRADQVRTWLVSDNACDLDGLDAVVWDAVITTADDAVADRVVLQSTAGLTATAGNPAGRYVYTETAQLWRDQAAGDTLAADLYADQRTARLRLDQFAVHLLDPHQPELWRAVDWRLLDRMNFAHQQRVAGGISLVVVEVLIVSLHHAITVAGGWRITASTTRATATHVAVYYWDTTPFTWDDPDLRNVWS